MVLKINDQAQGNITGLREHTTSILPHMRGNISCEIEQNSDNRYTHKNVGDQSGWLYWRAVKSSENQENLKKNDQRNSPLRGGKNKNVFGGIKSPDPGNNIPKNAIQKPGVIIANPGGKVNRGIDSNFKLIGAQNSDGSVFFANPNNKVTRGITVTYPRRKEILNSKSRLAFLQKIPRKIYKRKFMEAN